MKKIKEAVVLIVIGSLIVATGVIYFNNKKGIKQETKMLSQSANKVKEELIHKLKGTKELKVYHNYHEESIDDINHVTITDKDIIDDFIDLLSIAHENNLKDTSGYSVDKQKLVFILDKAEIEIDYTYDSLYETGFITYDGQNIDLPYDFFRLISNVERYSPRKSSIPKDVEKLFKQYDWTPSFLVSKYSYKLPRDLMYAPEKGVDSIYWAYNLEFSKSINLDFSNLLGKEIEAEVYYLIEEMPKFTQPILDANAVVIRYNGKIVGSYIDSGILNRAVSSLDRRSFEDITGDYIENFIIKNNIDKNSKLDKEISEKTAEELIKTYYQSMYNKDVKTHLATLDIGNILNYMDIYNSQYNGSGLYNSIEWDDDVFIHANNTEVLEVEEVNSENEEFKNFKVKVNIKVSNDAIQEKGIYDMIVSMRKDRNGRYKVNSVGF